MPINDAELSAQLAQSTKTTQSRREQARGHIPAPDRGMSGGMQATMAEMSRILCSAPLMPSIAASSASAATLGRFEAGIELFEHGLQHLEEQGSNNTQVREFGQMMGPEPFPVVLPVEKSSCAATVKGGEPPSTEISSTSRLFHQQLATRTAVSSETSSSSAHLGPTKSTRLSPPTSFQQSANIGSIPEAIPHKEFDQAPASGAGDDRPDQGTTVQKA